MSQQSAPDGYYAEAAFYDYTWDSLKADIRFYNRRLKGSKRILDLMCGTGRVALALARAGFEVDGIDESAAMLRRARQKARSEPPSVRRRLHWHQSSLTRAKMGRGHDAAIIAVDSYGLILPSKDRVRALQHIHDALRPGGKLLLALDTVHSYRRIRDGIPFVASPPHRLNRGGGLYLRVMAESGSKADRVRSTTLHIVMARSGKSVRSRLTQTETAVLSPARVKSELVRAGFVPTHLFGGYNDRPYSAKGDCYIIESVAR